MTNITESLEYIKAAAMRSPQPCKLGAGTINGRTVTAMVTNVFRNEVRWKVDGSSIQEASLVRVLGGLN